VLNKKLNRDITQIDLGRKAYKVVWDMQEEKLRSIVAIKRKNRELEIPLVTPNYFFWVEHPPVITLGKSGLPEHLLLNETQLTEKGIEFFTTNRGGDITFHGSGQLVGYPILDLENFFTDIHKYLRLLEEMVILTLLEYGLNATRSNGETGVWLDVGTPFARKICAIGVKASRWVTMHGFALNVNTDLSYFEYIVPCGIRGKAVTSLSKELGYEVSFDQVKEKLKTHFSQLFEAKFIENQKQIKS
jgi:lipoyl(octanoyl) transferase